MTAPLVTRANLAVVGGLAAMLVVIGGLTLERFDAAREARDWTRHSDRVIVAIKDLDLAVRDAETGQRGYLLTGDAGYLSPYESALGRVGFLEGELQRLTADNAGAQQRLRDLAPVLQHKLEELAQTIQLRRSGNAEAAMGMVTSGVGRAAMQTIETTLAAMADEETTLLAQRQRQSDRRGDWVLGLTSLGTVVALAGLLLAARLLNAAWRRSMRAEAEQRRLAIQLQTSFDSLSQGLAVFDPDGRLVEHNAGFASLLGLGDDALRSGVAYDAVVGAAASESGPLLERADQVRHGRHAPGAPVTYERQRGDRHLELRRTGMPGGGFVLTVSDMTTRVQADAVLRESQKMQAVGQLTGGLAHDFNNLLTVILGNLEVLRARLGRDSPLQNRVERGIWAAERGATLTRQLLAFARKQPLAPKPIALDAVIPDLVPLLRRTLGETIEVRYVETAGLWPAMADAAQVESAVLNLALNARDAMANGGRLTIEVANKVLDAPYCAQNPDVAPGDYAMIAVSDTGHGMSAEVLARAFEPFFTTKPDGKGTGLGLAMVFGFAKQSGGHLKIYSEPDHGTTVRLYLPRAIGAPGRAGLRPSAPVDLPQGSATILVVEDDPAVREIACAILVDLGYRVIAAQDGEEGLRLFERHAEEIDMLLSDVVLPGAMRGRQLAEAIAALKPRTRVLFMSGYTENSIVHNGRLDDGVHLLGKPFHRDDLARKVAEVLGMPAPEGGTAEALLRPAPPVGEG